ADILREPVQSPPQLPRRDPRTAARLPARGTAGGGWPPLRLTRPLTRRARCRRTRSAVPVRTALALTPRLLPLASRLGLASLSLRRPVATSPLCGCDARHDRQRQANDQGAESHRLHHHCSRACFFRGIAISAKTRPIHGAPWAEIRASYE